MNKKIKNLYYRAGLLLMGSLTFLPWKNAIGDSTLALPTSTPCNQKALALLQKWDSKLTWTRNVDSSPGVRVYSSPTETLGVWTTIEFPMDGKGDVSVYRVSPSDTTRVTLSYPECRSQIQITPLASVHDRTREFSDEDLKSMLDTKKSGVIFTWSPHMVLSNQAYPALKTAAEKRGLEIIIVMDPFADEPTAEGQTKRNGWDEKSLRRVTSVEILNRGIANHYPSILFFANGVLSNRLYPGLKTDDQYGEFLDEELKAVGK